MKKYILIFVLMILFAGISPAVSAATLNVVSPSAVHQGDEFGVDVKIESENEGINGIEATFRFDSTILEAVRVDKENSVFNLWMVEPAISHQNGNGEVSFTAASVRGFSGKSLQVFRITFKALRAGKTNISAPFLIIIANDGKGTDVALAMKTITVSVVPKNVPLLEIPKLPDAGARIFPLVSTVLPTIPSVSISLYPDQNRWSGAVSQFTASWVLPLDVTRISTILDKSPYTDSLAMSDGMYNSKTFSALQDGVWYFHLRFQNNIGWGPTNHYKIAVDTIPPVAFKISQKEGENTDNPRPVLQFATTDALSGLKEYQVQVGNNTIVRIPVADFKGDFILPIQAPGKIRVLVRAVDKADNGIEDFIFVNIVPIVGPEFTTIPRELFSDNEEGLTVKGIAEPRVSVLVALKKISKEIIAEGIAYSDTRGNWNFTFGNQMLKNGKYVVQAVSRDSRGALSFPVLSDEITVKTKPVFQMGIFELGMNGVALFLLLLLLGGFVSGIFFNKKRQEKLKLRTKFAESEIDKIFALIVKDIESLYQSFKTPTSVDDEYLYKELNEKIKKMEAYLKKGVEKIKR